jgi:hypothetical protein
MNTALITAAKELTALFPFSEVKYSLGFERMSSLSRKKRKECFLKLYLEGFTEIKDNDKELKERLTKMTEVEFNSFKK